MSAGEGSYIQYKMGIALYLEIIQKAILDVGYEFILQLIGHYLNLRK